MVSKFLNLSLDTSLGGDNASDYIAVSQKAIKTYVDSKSGGGSSDNIPMFFAMTTDHILQGDEAIGWALQGSLVIDTYSTAVNKIKSLYNSSSSVSSTYRNINCKLTADGRYIADISQKSAIDTLFDQTGIADFYILDESNNRFYLPKTKWYHQFTLDTSLVNKTNDYSSSTYDSSNETAPTSSNRLLYYKVGNTVVNEQAIDINYLVNTVTNLLTRVDDLETLIAKCYTGTD